MAGLSGGGYAKTVNSGISRPNYWGKSGGGTPDVPELTMPTLPALPEYENKVQKDPRIEALLDDWKSYQGDWQKYRGELASGTDVDAINSMQRQRDLMSGMAKEFGEMQGFRGVGGALGLSRIAAQGSRDMSNLNAANVSDARKQQMAALSGEGSALSGASGLAVNQAGITLGQQQFGLSQWNTLAQAALAQQQLQAQIQQNNVANMMQALQFYTG